VGKVTVDFALQVSVPQPHHRLSRGLWWAILFGAILSNLRLPIFPLFFFLIRTRLRIASLYCVSTLPRKTAAELTAGNFRGKEIKGTFVTLQGFVKGSCP
jgi:hypothetical protein